ncbi:MAG: hypothetical protein AB7T86_08340 [Xanthobacteraceae bacterium]|uniref:hypothetical protein n=1 Tax=Pseudolabrys sp. TaxID=1960880 RepID=UPI003D0D69EE
MLDIAVPGQRQEATMVRMLVRTLLVSVPLLLATGATLAHDSWINRGGFKNTAGEWCCGEGDCFVVPGKNVSIAKGGYTLFGTEVIPFNQALPSPDGAYWRCKRPDGSPRCFFAPPTGM